MLGLVLLLGSMLLLDARLLGAGRGFPLAAVSRALRSPELREQLRQARTTDAIRALFVKDATAATAA